MSFVFNQSGKTAVIPSSMGIGGAAAPQVPSWGVGGAAAPPPPAKVVWQLVMRCCDRTSLLRLARCNRDCWAAASEAFAWGVLSDRIEWFTMKHDETIAATFGRAIASLRGDTQSRSSATLGARLDKSLLRNCDVGIRVESPLYYGSAALQALLVSVRRLRGLDMDALGARWNDPEFDLTRWRLRELRGNSPLTVQHMIHLITTQPKLRVLSFNISMGQSVSECGPLRKYSFPAVRAVVLKDMTNNPYAYVLDTLHILFPRLDRIETAMWQFSSLVKIWWIPNRTVFPHVRTLRLYDIHAIHHFPADLHRVFPRLHTLELYPTRGAIDACVGLRQYITTMSSRPLPVVPEVIELHWPPSGAPNRDAFDALQRTYPGRFRLMW